MITEQDTKEISDGAPNVVLGAWIKCCDELPEENVKVLCATKKNGLTVMSFTFGWKMRYVHGPSWRDDSVSSLIRRLELHEVTHWMPLPEPPNA